MRPPVRAARIPGLDRKNKDTPRYAQERRQSQTLRRYQRFHRLTERLHHLGPRPVGELLLEVAGGRDLIEALEDYAQLGPVAVARLGGRDWLPMPIARVA
jgi:hypothetical protein